MPRLLTTKSFNPALGFNVGTSNAINSSASLLQLTTISFEYWVKCATWTGNNYDTSYIYKNGTNGRPYLTYGGRPGESLVWEMRPADFSYHSYVSVKTNWKLGQWYHIVGTYNNATGIWTMYINGVMDGRKTEAISMDTTAGNIMFNLGNKFTGALKDVRIYNRVLTPREVEEHYNGLYTDDTGLIAYWKCDEGNGNVAYDSSGNSIDMTLTNPRWADCGIKNLSTRLLPSKNFDNVLEFNRTNTYIDCGNNSSLNITGALSIEAWINTKDITAQQMIFCRGLDQTDGYYLQLVQTKVELSLDRAGVNYYTQFNIPFSNNTWNHIVGVNTGTTTRLYLNGVEMQVSRYGSYGNPLTSSRNAKIGAYDTNALKFKGLLRDVKVYSRALTPREIEDHYNGLYSNDSGLVGCWNINEGNGTTAFDITSNANNGTITSGTWKNTGSKQLSSRLSITTIRPSLKKYFETSLNFVSTSDVYVDCGTSSSLRVETGNFTLEVWVKPLSHITAGNRYSILAFYNPGWIFDLVNDSGSEGYRFFTGTALCVYYPPGGLMSLDWTHFSFTYNIASQTGHMYVNGVRVATWTGISITTSTNPLCIGKRTDGQYFKGLIRDIKIYNRQMSPEEMVQHYNGIYVNETGLVGYWKLNEGGGTTAVDSSGTGNTGTIYGSPPWNYNSGNKTLAARMQLRDFKYSGLFNGTDNYVNCGAGTSLDLTSQITLSMWIKPPKTYTTNYYVFSRVNGDYSKRLYAYIDNGGLLHFGTYDSSTFEEASYYLTTKEWIYVTFVYTPNGTWGNIKIYENRILKNSASSTRNIPTLTGFNFIISSATGSYMLGNIDDFRIYNIALDIGQIQQLYYTGVCPCPQNMVAWWQFNEGNGNTIADSSGNGNTGTWNGTGQRWSKDTPL